MSEHIITWEGGSSRAIVEPIEASKLANIYYSFYAVTVYNLTYTGPYTITLGKDAYAVVFDPVYFSMEVIDSETIISRPPKVSTVDYSQESIDATFLNNTNTVIEKFTCVEGSLSLTLLDGYAYDAPTIQSTFEHLKNYNYNESIFEYILYSLTSFLTAITVKDDVSHDIDDLVQKLESGVITLDEYNKLVKKIRNEYIIKAIEIYNRNLEVTKKAITNNMYLLD